MRLYLLNRKKSGESITDTPIRCRIPKMMKPSPRYSHVAAVTRRPSEKMPAPRRRNFFARADPDRFAAARSWLTTRETPTIRRKRVAVA